MKADAVGIGGAGAGVGRFICKFPYQKSLWRKFRARR
jgi:hypothetical protein